MSNNVPAHLMSSKLAQQDSSIYHVAGGALNFPRISLGRARFTSIDAEGDKIDLGPTSIEFIVIAGNPHQSRVYYSTGYNPDNISAPDCYSDNGTAPDSRVARPESDYCHSCPQAQWGSSVSKRTDKGVPACSSSKKLAVYLMHKEAEGLHMLRIPPASLKAWGQYVLKLENFRTDSQGTIRVTPSMVYTRATMTEDNTLTFERVDWVDEDSMSVIYDLQAEQEFEAWIGADKASLTVRDYKTARLEPAPERKLTSTVPEINDRGEKSIIDVSPDPRRKPLKKQEMEEELPSNPIAAARTLAKRSVNGGVRR
jgi:hypothetical protein